MQTREFIEQLVVAEMKGLCSGCFHQASCFYRKVATKSVIQCELFEADFDLPYAAEPLKGLCKTCDHASDCKLPGRNGGVWHCNEFI
jgi:hypothetical protein